MIKRKLLQLIACGIASLSIACVPYPGKDMGEEIPLTEYSSYSCNEYIYITGYYPAQLHRAWSFFDDSLDPDMRFAIPVIHSSAYAKDNPTDTTMVNIGKCLIEIIEGMEIEYVIFDGEVFTIDMAIELANY